MRRHLCYLLVACFVLIAISCKKNSSTVALPVLDTVKGHFHINYRGTDYNHTYSSADTPTTARIEQGNIFYGDTFQFAKEFSLVLSDKIHVAVDIHAHKLNETVDTGIYKIGVIYSICNLGTVYFFDTLDHTYEGVNDTTSSYVHLTEFNRGTRNHMKGTLRLLVCLKDSTYYATGYLDSAYITGEFDITK